ncbi:hypothetical protein SNEBB_008757 [Seison nebaliae]|nr:hypothetical protein SNEBB_008757 [Seison nebaliae]
MKDGGGLENIGEAQIRAGTIWSKTMTKRWKSDENKLKEEEMRCDKCGNGRETTYARTERHDRVLDKICSNYIRRDLKFFREPRIKTKKGLKIPELIIKDKDVAVVTDLQVSEEGLMKTGERIKLKKYDDEEVKKFAMKELHCKTVKITSMVRFLTKVSELYERWSKELQVGWKGYHVDISKTDRKVDDRDGGSMA